MPKRFLMGAQDPSGSGRYLPHALLATGLVVLTPTTIVWRLAAGGTIVSFLPLAAIGLLLATLLAYTGNIAWRSRSDSNDFPFPDLMLWGWVRRVLAERRLAEALEVLDLDNDSAPTELEPEIQIGALKSLASSLELLDPYTHGHSQRVARYAALIATTMRLPEEQINKVRTAAAVHDVGKLEVPLEILNKPGRLTDEEFDVIKTHALRGAEMVRALGDPELTEMVAHHHERLDGSGYPARLGGTEIPLGARIIAVADTFDALTSTRAYRPAKRQSEALGIIHAEAGTQLDPLVVGAFDRCFEEMLGGLFVWPLLAALPHRLWAPFESQAQLAGGAAVGKAFAVVATTAATGSIMVGGGLTDPRDTSTNDALIMASANFAQASGVAGVSGPVPRRYGTSSAQGNGAGRGASVKVASISTRQDGADRSRDPREAGVVPGGGEDGHPSPAGSEPSSPTPATDAPADDTLPVPDIATETIESVGAKTPDVSVPTVPSVPKPPSVPAIPAVPNLPANPGSTATSAAANVTTSLPELPKP